MYQSNFEKAALKLRLFTLIGGGGWVILCRRLKIGLTNHSIFSDIHC